MDFNGSLGTLRGLLGTLRGLARPSLILKDIKVSLGTLRKSMALKGFLLGLDGFSGTSWSWGYRNLEKT